MIYDKLNNIGIYKGLSKNLDTAIDYILTHDLNNLPLGRTVVDGDQVYINCMEASTDRQENRKYEVHQDHLDIQIDLEGTERLITGDQKGMEMGKYDPSADCAFGQCSPLAECTLGSGNFVICMTGEPHMPGVALSHPEKIRKCVFKVRKS